MGRDKLKAPVGDYRQAAVSASKERYELRHKNREPGGSYNPIR